MTKNKFVSVSAVIIGIFALFQACQNESQIAYARAYTNGNQVYDQHCQNCHSGNGEGLNGLIPPLTDTFFLKRNRNKLACIIKHGLNDTIKVNNQTFTNPMPPLAQLTADDIADVVTYVTNSFGNNQGLYDVTHAGSDLKNCLHDEDK